jgi:hypothetical protein
LFVGALGAVALEAVGLLLSGWGVGGNVVVRCRDGHLFATLWIPGVSFKALRLGWWRVQRCPVGHHWSIVTPARRAGLSDDELWTARQHRDMRLP